jgi:hypothetical protein
MKKFIKTFIKTISLLVLVGAILPTPSWSDPAGGNAKNETVVQGKPIPDELYLELNFIGVNTTNVKIQARYRPTKELLENPPTITLQYGDNRNEYYSSIPMPIGTGEDQEHIYTVAVLLTQLKPGTVYHFNMTVKYLGVLYEMGDSTFKTQEGL